MLMFLSPEQIACSFMAGGRVAASNQRTAFTLVELMVSLVIISILAGLSLAGLAGARQRAKIDKTRSTIRKIDAVIRPMYDSYRTRRVSSKNDDGSDAALAANGATNRLVNIRRLMTREMPDSWVDVPATNSEFNNLPVVTKTGAVRAYQSFKSMLARRTDEWGSAECLFLIAARSGFEPDALEFFRADEVIDSDNDGASEFSDGWGRPVAFMRWAPAFSSIIQGNSYSVDSHDPLDPLKVSNPPDYALVPLVYSAGPDEGDGLVAMNGWASENLASIRSVTVSGAANAAWNGKRAGDADPSAPSDAADNITNHDLTKK